MQPSPHIGDQAPRFLRRLDTPVAGTLWLSAMPGRDGGWPAFVEDARRARLDFALCLTPRHEIDALSPAYAAAIDAGALPFAWQALPMRDLGVAAGLEAFALALEPVAIRLQRGEQVLLHCAAGIGRTGTTAACLLMRLGQPPAAALEAVRQAGSSPESASQSAWVARFKRAPGP